MEATTPAEIDTRIADLYRAATIASDRADQKAETLKGAAGAKYYYIGRRRLTDMTVETAREVVETALAAGQNLLHGYTLRHYGKPSMVEEYDALLAARAAAWNAYSEMNARYTGWSRFFLVTSSKGHIHSSMDCSTCRAQTTFGWLPNLSGQSEAEAVEECGPALCSVCFPSAPVEWTTGQLTKAQAERKAG